MRISMAEAERFPEQAAQYCDVLFTQVHARLDAYLQDTFVLSPATGAQAAHQLLGQILHPRFPQALLGLEPLTESFSEDGTLPPDLDLRPIRRAVAALLDSLAKP